MTSMIFHEAIEVAVFENPRGADRLLSDVEAIMGGNAPTNADLMLAPLLDHWVPVIGSKGTRISLAGKVDGHPIRRDGLIVTSPLCAIEAETFTWARTCSRWYRLGRHFGRFQIKGRTH